MSLRSLTLRVKLTLWYTFVFAFIQYGLVAAVFFYRGNFVRHYVDQRKLDSAEALAKEMRDFGEPRSAADLREMIDGTEGFLHAWVRDPTGRIMARTNSPDIAPPPLSARESEMTGMVSAKIEALQEREAERLTGRSDKLRLITIPYRERGGYPLYIQVIARTADLGVFSELFSIYLPIGLIGAAFAAWLIAGRAVKPILQLSEAAAQVSPTGGSIDLQHSEEEITRLNGSLNKAIGRMEAGYRAQEQFISNVSHELKTPISVILTESQVLARGRATREEYSSWAQKVTSEMQRLGRLVESFLKLTRTTGGNEPNEREPVRVLDLALETVSHCTPLAILHSVRLVPNISLEGADGPDPIILGDEDLLRTLLDNLICNAIRFSPTDAVVEINVAFEPGYALCTVRDHGPGMPDEYLTTIFDRFVQVPGQNSRSKGTGLGLSIAQHIAQVHGGEVSAKNNPDGGCSFITKLPVEPSELPTDDDGASPREPSDLESEPTKLS